MPLQPGLGRNWWSCACTVTTWLPLYVFIFLNRRLLDWGLSTGDLVWHSPFFIISVLKLSYYNLPQSSPVIFTKIRKAMYFHHVTHGPGRLKDHQLSVCISQTYSSISATPKPCLGAHLRLKMKHTEWQFLEVWLCVFCPFICFPAASNVTNL